MSTDLFKARKSKTKNVLSIILVLVMFAGFFSFVESGTSSKAYAATDQPILGGSTLTPAQMA